MKAVIFNGMKADDALTASVHRMLTQALEAKGWEVEPLLLHQIEIAPCVGCFGCWVQTPGRCVLEQGAAEVARAMIHSDLTIFLSPVTFGGYSYPLKKALDHMIVLIAPFFAKVDDETHHQRRYQSYPRLMGLGTMPHADAESAEIFQSLVTRNAINMWAPAHAAGVITGDQDDVTVRDEIERLLAKVEGVS